MRVVMNNTKASPKKRVVSKKAYLAITIFVLLLGVLLGCYTASNLGSLKVTSLKDYLNGFSIDGDLNNLLTVQKLTNNIWESFKYILIIWLMGFSGYLILGTIIINCYKGFIEGFTTYFLISKFGIEGMKLAGLPLLAYKIFYIYLIIFISSSSLSFALRRDRKLSLRDKEFRKYILHILFALVAICAVGVLETLSTPYILKAIIQ